MYKLRTEQGYNTIVHSHPFSSNPSFSGADDAHVNKQWSCSLLSNDDGEICDATILFKLEDGETIMQLPIKSSKIDRWDTSGGLEVEGLDKIVDKVTLPKPATKVATQEEFYDTSKHNSRKVAGVNGNIATTPSRELPMDSDAARERHHDWTAGYKKYKIFNQMQALQEYESASTYQWLDKMAWIEKHFFSKHPDALSALSDKASLIYGMRKYGVTELEGALPVYTKAVEDGDVLLMAWIEANFLDTTDTALAKKIVQESSVGR
jgi:hypothetical protein